MYDLIGDVHGCFEELKDLIEKLGYTWEEGIPKHPDGRKLVFVGDLMDRGPDSISVMELVWKLVVEKQAGHYSPGNHCDKLYRYFLGNKVQIKHGLETTVAEYESLGSDDQEKVKSHFMELFDKAPLYLQLDEGNLVVAHAGIRHDYIGKESSRVRTFVLYGDISGEKNPDGTPVRRDWAQHYEGKPLIVYGHTPVQEVRKVNNTFNIDTGCVFGGKLSALRYPELEIKSVPSQQPVVPEKFRSFND